MHELDRWHLVYPTPHGEAIRVMCDAEDRSSEGKALKMAL